MKKIIALSIFLLAFTANAFAFKVTAYFAEVVSPGCYRVLVVVTEDYGHGDEVVGSGYFNVGSGCSGQNITTAPGSPNDLAGLMAKHPEIQTTAEEFIRNRNNLPQK